MEDVKIFFDMDGVLADFDKGILELCGIPRKDQGSRTKEERAALWKAVNRIPHFYDCLDPMEGAVDFFRKVYDAYGDRVEILTGIPSSVPSSAEDKKNWAKRILQRDVAVNAVKRADKVLKCTGPSCILIDDYEKNIGEWETIGGTGILHRSVSETERILEELLHTSR